MIRLSNPGFRHLSLSIAILIAIILMLLSTASHALCQENHQAFIWSNGTMSQLDINPFTTQQYFSYAYGINNAGVVVGKISYYNGTAYYPVAWTSGSMSVLPTLYGNSSATDINSSGDIVGSHYWDADHNLSSLENFPGYFYDGGCGHCYGINDSNQIAGIYDCIKAFIWQNGERTDLGTLGGIPFPYLGNGYSSAYAINNTGQVVGSSYIDDSNYHAFLWQDGTMVDLGALRENTSVAYGINDAGFVVGYTGGKTSQAHIFIWREGVMTDLGEGIAYSINNNDQIVGARRIEGTLGKYQAFLWEDGQFIDLGTLGGDSFALDINDQGQIVGYSTNVPIPASVLLLSTGLLFLSGIKMFDSYQKL